MKTKHVEIKDVFSSAAKYAFKKKGRKQKDVADEVGMSVSSANDYINGRREGDEGTRTRIAEALGYSYRDFMALGRHILEGGDPETWRPHKDVFLGGGSTETGCKPNNPKRTRPTSVLIQYGNTDDAEEEAHCLREMESLFKMILRWQKEENGLDSLTSMNFIREFHERFPEMGEWLKKQKGGDNQDRGLEKISTGTDE